MNNIEAGFNTSEITPKWNGGDLEIPLEYLLAVQQVLMLMMVPNAIKPHVLDSDGEHIGIEEKLFERWCEKYSTLFRLYCNNLDPQNEAEDKLIKRIVNGCLTSDDYLNLQNYLESSEDLVGGVGGKFFVNEAEIKRFMDENLIS